MNEDEDSIGDCFKFEAVKDPAVRKALKLLDGHIHDTMRRHNSILPLLDQAISMRCLELAILKTKGKETIEFFLKKTKKEKTKVKNK